MFTDLDEISREDIIKSNLNLHENTADQYDDIHYYLRNTFEQSILLEDLSQIHQQLQGRVGEPVRYLDLGCGTGNLTMKLLSLGGHVVGVDLSPAMINVLSQKVEKQGYKERFTGFAASADELQSSEDAKRLLGNIHAVCISSVLHHLHDYLAPFQQLKELCPSLQLVLITHEPCGREDLAVPNFIQSVYNHGIRRLDLLLSKRIRRPVEKCPDDPLADYHAFKNGISEAKIKETLSVYGLKKILIHRRYNMRRTSLASSMDNGLLSAFRNDIFPITMFTLAMMLDGD